MGCSIKLYPQTSYFFFNEFQLLVNNYEKKREFRGGQAELFCLIGSCCWELTLGFSPFFFWIGYRVQY